jgi:hypothetical protein
MSPLTRFLLAVSVAALGAACSGRSAVVPATQRDNLDAKDVEECIKNIAVPPSDPTYPDEVAKCVDAFDAGLPFPPFDAGLPGLPDVNLPEVGIPDVATFDAAGPPIFDAGGYEVDASFPLPGGGMCQIVFTCNGLSCFCDVGPKKGTSCSPGQCAQDCREGC